MLPPTPANTSLAHRDYGIYGSLSCVVLKNENYRNSVENAVGMDYTDREDGYVVMPRDQEEDRIMEARGRDDKEEKVIHGIKEQDRPSDLTIKMSLEVLL